MKKATTLFILFFLAFQMNVNAQKEITTVHLYDITNAETVKNYKESVNKVNKIMIEIGYPKNYYTFLSINASDTSSTYKYYHYYRIGVWIGNSPIAVFYNKLFK